MPRAAPHPAAGPSRRQSGEPLPDDALCAHCKYSLAGLRSGGRCPECGTPIALSARRPRLDDHLIDAPPHYLKTLAAGCWLMFAGAIVTAGLLLAVRGGLNPIFAGVAGVAGTIWWIGVWIVTAPRQSPNTPRAALEREYLRLRWTARISQAGWAVAGVSTCGLILATRAAMAAALAAVLPYTPGPLEQTFQALAIFGNLFGIIGLLPLLVVVGNLADWAGATHTADRFRASAWLVTLGTIGTALALPTMMARTASVFGPVGFLMYTIGGLSALAFLSGMVLLLFSLAQLAAMSLWAIDNAATRTESERRMAERRHRHIEQIGERSAAAHSPLPAAPGTATQGAVAPDPTIYALEPEQPDPRAQ